MKNEDVLSLLAKGLEAAANEHTASSLGDRRTYLGMSDLSRGLSCPRTIVADKLRSDNSDLNLEKLLQLRRGHWLEYGVEEALSALNIKFTSQLEISIQHQGVPIKAHLDLVLPDESSQSITVLELKSVGHLRNQVHGFHEAQLYGQLGLLSQFWNNPVFSAGRQFANGSAKPAYSKSYSFPELVRRQLGIRLSEDISSISVQGFVLTVSPKSAKAFGPYIPNGKVLKTLLETGQELWRQMEDIKCGRADLNSVAFQQGFAPLCDWCLHNHGCPKFGGADQVDLEPELAALAAIKEHRKAIDQEIKERERQLKSIADLMGLSGQWINSANYRFKVASQAGRVTLDQNALKVNLSQLTRVDRDQLLAAVEAAQKPGHPFERFHLSPINH